MGAVYEATHEALGTRVAIKVLHSDLARRTGLIERFMQEARVAAQIRSPHVVNVIDVDRTDDGIAYIVMELLEGEPLSATLDRLGRIPIPQACEYASQILSALEAAHALGVVHRDLKPENVFLTHAGTRPVLKLIDFGIAKLRSTDPGKKNLTVAGVVMGTAEYMAPEQAYSADRADARSDLYAVGVMLYEMLAGQRPVSGDDARVIALKVERGEATPLVHVMPEVPRELAGLVHRAMAARPELRFASATEMRLALEGAISGKRVPTVPLPIAAVHDARAAVDARARAEAVIGGGGVLGASGVSATGTMQGAPAAEVLAAAQAARAGHSHLETHHDRETPPPRTERVAPAPFALTPAPMNAPPLYTHSPPPRTAPRKRGTSLWLLILLPLLAGGGVVAFQLASADREPLAPIAPLPTAAPPTVLATGPATQPAASPQANQGNAVAPLITPHTPASPAHPGPAATGPHASPSGTSNTPTAPTETAPPFAFPSAIPSVFPFPVPSGSNAPAFPFPLPSGFPTAFPGFPAPPSNTAPSSTATTPSTPSLPTPTPTANPTGRSL